MIPDGTEMCVCPKREMGILAAAAPANADAPEPGASCSSGEIGLRATASDGTAVRCLVDDEGAIRWLASTGAVDTIAQLQNEGYTVSITRVGSGPLEQCMVAEVRNPTTTTRTTRSHTGAGGVNTIIVSKTIDVTLNCPG